MASFTTQGCLLDLYLHTQQITLLPMSTEGLQSLRPCCLQRIKTRGRKVIVTTTKSKSRKSIEGVNSVGNMDRGPMKFTSDVSLPKDDKTAMQDKQITAGQFTGLWAQPNANYATKERKRLKSMGGTPR